MSDEETGGPPQSLHSTTGQAAAPASRNDVCRDFIWPTNCTCLGIMTIVCGSDFSPASARAVRLSGAMARMFGDRVTLVHAIDLPAASPAFDESAGFGAALREDVERSLELQASSLRMTGVEVETRAEPGGPVDALVRLATQAHARLLVVGAHGRRGAARLLLGSVAERVVRTAATPVLVVPATVDERHMIAAPPADPLRVVAAVDFSTSGDAVVAWVRDLRRELACNVTFLHLFWPPREYQRMGLDIDAHQHDDCEHEVTDLLGRELSRRVGPPAGEGRTDLRVRATWGSDPAPLAWEAEVLGADLLVVGSRQRRGMSGSTAIGTLRASSVPVICVPQRTAPQVPGSGAYRSPRRLLVPTDLSETGNSAVAEAYRLLRAGGGIIELLHVAEHELSPQERDVVEHRLRVLVPAGAGDSSIVTRTTIEEAARPVQSILHTARRHDADLIVMGSHGRSGLTRSLLGSIAESVMRGADRPVMVVRAESPS